MNQRSFVWLVFGASLAISVLLFNIVVTFQRTQDLNRDVARVVHTQKVLTELANLRALMNDAETGQRGFLITGDSRYLDPYESAVKTVNEELDQIQILTADNAGQQTRLKELRQSVDSKLAELRETLNLRQQKGFDVAQTRVLEGRGKRTMDEFRSVVAAMESNENTLLTNRTSESSVTFQGALYTGLTTGISALVAIVAFVALLLRTSYSQTRANNIIAEQAESFRTTLFSIGDAVITTDKNGLVTNMNPVAESMTRWTVAQAKGKPLEVVFNIVNETSRERVESPAVKALREGTIVGLANHTVLIAQDGSELPIDDSAAPIKGLEGEVNGVVLVFRDVTERRAAERALTRSEHELTDFFENATVGLHWVGPEGVILRANQAELDMLGYTKDEFIGHRIEEFHADLDVIGDILKSLESGQALKDQPARLRCKNGSVREVLISSSGYFEDGIYVHSRCFTQDVTDRNAARRAEASLAAIVESSDDVIISKTLEGVIVSWNSAAEHVLGYTSDEAVGQSIDLIVPESLISEERTILRRLRNGERIAHFQTKRRTKDGRLVDLSLTISPIRDKSGEIIGASKVARDITIEKRMAAAQLESDQRLGLALEAGQLGSWEWTFGSDKVEWSPNLEAIYGFQSGTFPGTFESYQERIHPDDLQEVRDEIANSLKSGEDHHTEHRIIWPDGSVHWVEGRGKVFHDEQGVAVRMIGVCGEITERKKSEQDARFLGEASATLTSLGDYQTTLERVAQLAVPSFADWCAIDIVDENGRLKRLAVVHQDPTKQSLAEQLQRRFQPDPDARDGSAKVVRTGESELVHEVSDEILNSRAPDSETLAIVRSLGLRSWMIVPLKIHNRVLGSIAFISAESGRRYDEDDLAVAEDLARRAAIAIENSRLYQEVRENDRRKDEFLATLAHELRNPLAPIRYALEIMKQSDGDAEAVTRAQATSERQLAHLVRLVDDLLDVSRITRDKLELKKANTDLASIVHQAVETARPLAESKNHTIDIVLPREPVYLNADPMRLSQVFSNLLNNACKYSPDGSRVVLEVSTEGNDAFVRVKDNGVGIPESMLSRIFDMFTQVETSLERSQGGLGIGLTLVRRLVELHDGSVSASSPGPNLGSEFTVRLPKSQSDQESAVRSNGSPPAKEDQAESAAKGLRILVVDDNTDAARSLSLLLEMYGHEARTAHDGVEAVSIAEDYRPDLVLMDIGLPTINGYEAAARIRSHSWGEDIVLVAVTGWGQDEDRRKSKESGFDVHLVKPVSKDALLKVLTQIGPKIQGQETDGEDSSEVRTSELT